MNVVQNNLISIVILLILFLGILGQFNIKDDIYRLFLILLLMTAFMHILEVIIYLLSGNEGEFAYNGIRFFSVLYHMLIPVILAMIFVFFDHHFHEKGRRMIVYLIPFFILFVINLVFSILSLTKGYLFIITENNEYMAGSVYQLYEILIYVVLLITHTYTAILRKKISTQAFIPLAIFIVPPTVSIILTLSLGYVYMTWHSLMISFLLVFMMMQYQITSTDYLTGLKNRRGYDRVLRYLDKNHVEEIIIGIMIDIDNFKRINDSYGHAKGDEALKAVGDILRKVVRRNDFISRTGGDEFAIIMQSSDPEIKYQVVHRIKEHLKTLNEENVLGFPIHISIGCDIYDKTQYKTIHHFFEYLDQKMYHNKRISNESVS